MADERSVEEEFRAALERVLDLLQIDADGVTRERMAQHYRLLRSWNRRLNLTRIVDPLQAAERHFGESLFLAKRLGVTQGRIADIGSGAGFPGLAVAAWLRKTEVTAIEASVRKAVFLREASRDWGNVRVESLRAEEVEGRFDWALMRAVAPAGALDQAIRLAERVALLVGAAGAADTARDRRLQWERPIPAPVGRGVLLIGARCST